MSRKGGYKIIDLKGLDFSTNKVIDGIHESIEDNYGKPLLFSGIVIDGVEKDDVFANVVVNGDGYDVTLYDETLHISNVDVVSKYENEIELTQDSDNGSLWTSETLLNYGKYLVKIFNENYSTMMVEFVYIERFTDTTTPLTLIETSDGMTIGYLSINQNNNFLEVKTYSIEDSELIASSENVRIKIIRI